MTFTPRLQQPRHPGKGKYKLKLITDTIVHYATYTLGSLSTLSLDTSGATSTEGRGQSEVNVLLAVKSDHEGGDVDDLLTNTKKNCQRGTQFIPEVPIEMQD
jgi:hypothetical protein